MQLHSVTAIIAAAAFALLLPVQGWAQPDEGYINDQVRIVDCAGTQSYDYSLDSCSDFDPDILYYSRMLAYRALEFAPRLPQGLYLVVVFNYSNEFSYQFQEGWHVITVGEGMMIDMWNSYVDVWDLYEYDGDAYDPDADYKAFVEWAFYHEIGHALVTHTPWEHDDKDHETLADDFATITMIRLYPEIGEGGAYPAEQAAQGLYFLSLPDAERDARSGKRKAFAQSAPQKRPQTKRRGVDGNMGAHEPNPQRAWEIACLVAGSGLADPPDDYQVDSSTHYECLPEDFEDTLDELVEYAPSLLYGD